MQLLQCLIALDKLHKNHNYKRHYVVPSRKDSHIEVQLIPIFHPTNIQPMCHAHLWLALGF
jgi:hypothetical protein